MKVLYIAPRYHTNQVPVVKGWLEQGNYVKFISQYAGKTEDYSYLKPEILGYSPVFSAILLAYRRLFARKLKSSANIQSFQMKYGFPPIRKLVRSVKEFRPDIVILRERSVYNICAYLLCKRLPCTFLLYNQTPLLQPEPVKNDLPHRLVRKLTPSKRITPVMGHTGDGFMDPDSYFVPFVVEPQLLSGTKAYFRGNQIHLLCVAKYESRKNILMLLEIFHTLVQSYDLTLTLAGEVSTDHHESYFHSVVSYVKEKGLDHVVELKKNLDRAAVYQEYEKADLFILPSTKEFASISQLEAMSCALPVICSDKNGAACYIENGKSGYLFRDNDSTDLRNKVEALVKNKEKIADMGRFGYNLVKEQYTFRVYQQKIQELI